MTSQISLFPLSQPDTLAFEKSLYRDGYLAVAGVDEAGRGPLAGPVVAAAVVLPQNHVITGVDDSKKLSPHKRAQLFTLILEQAVAVGIGMAGSEEVDRINILQATRSAMLQAVERLSCPPDYILVDGITPLATTIPQKTVIKGDSLSLSIAAASIIAKVTRDRLMIEMNALYPGYGFDSHKGYGCASHLDAIRQLGPCPIHRLTFGGVREYAHRVSVP